MKKISMDAFAKLAKEHGPIFVKEPETQSVSVVASGGASAKDPRVLIDGKDVTGVKKREPVFKSEISDFKDAKGHLDIKKLKGTVCDPNKALTWRCYSRKSGKFYKLALKRMKAIDKLCFYRGENGRRYTGKIIAFLITDGTPVLYCKDAIPPDMSNPEITLIMP